MISLRVKTALSCRLAKTYIRRAKQEKRTFKLVGIPHNKRFGDLILHLFLQQIHHRNQITTLLSQEYIDFGDTDLPEIV